MKNKKKFIFIGLGTLMIAYLLFGDKFNIHINCPFYQLTHLYCPGCGITRALRALLMGNFYQAFRYNNLIVLLPLFLIYYLEEYLQKKNYKTLNLNRFMNNKFWISLLICVIGYGILRNINYFSFLAPTNI